MTSPTTMTMVPGRDARLGNIWRSTMAVFDRMDHDEKVFLSYQIVLIELFLVVTLSFGYAGLILFAEAAAATTLTTIVLITSTGLRTPRNAIARHGSTESTSRPRANVPLHEAADRAGVRRKD